MLTYNKTEIVEDIVNKIKNYDRDSHHLVLIYGTKSNTYITQSQQRKIYLLR